MTSNLSIGGFELEPIQFTRIYSRRSPVMNQTRSMWKNIRTGARKCPPIDTALVAVSLPISEIYSLIPCRSREARMTKVA